MTRTHQTEPFLDLSLPVADDKTRRPRKMCRAGVEDDSGDYTVTPNKSSGSGLPPKHAQKKESKSTRRANRHGQSTAAGSLRTVQAGQTYQLETTAGWRRRRVAR